MSRMRSGFRSNRMVKWAVRILASIIIMAGIFVCIPPWDWRALFSVPIFGIGMVLFFHGAK